MNNTTVSRIGFAAENERLLEKARLSGIEINSFDGWKLQGKFVKRGEKQKAIRVKSGLRAAGTDPISGESIYEPCYKTCFGFTKEQVN
jgi:hypothetical protein